MNILPKCGGCGSGGGLQPVRDKKQNSGFLCAVCSGQYAALLGPESIRNFWMCGACRFRILAGTAIDVKVDELSGRCPHCRADVNFSLVNLSNNKPVGTGIIGEPLE